MWYDVIKKNPVLTYCIVVFASITIHVFLNSLHHLASLWYSLIAALGCCFLLSVAYLIKQLNIGTRTKLVLTCCLIAFPIVSNICITLVKSSVFRKESASISIDKTSDPFRVIIWDQPDGQKVHERSSTPYYAFPLSLAVPAITMLSSYEHHLALRVDTMGASVKKEPFNFNDVNNCGAMLLESGVRSGISVKILEENTVDTIRVEGRTYQVTILKINEGLLRDLRPDEQNRGLPPLQYTGSVIVGNITNSGIDRQLLRTLIPRIKNTPPE